jgi:RNA polymerase sigma-70 factor, ECF subfamily
MPELECPHCKHPISPGVEGCPHSHLINGKIKIWLSTFLKKYPRIQLPESSLYQKLNTIFIRHFAKDHPFPEQPQQENKNVADFLNQLCWEDLCLATACESGDPHAWQIFQDRYRSSLERAAKSTANNPAEGLDIATTLCSDLFLPTSTSKGEGIPKISQYHGLGSLEGWLKVLIARLAIDRIRSQRRQTSLEDLEHELVLPESNRSATHLVQSTEIRKAAKLFGNAIQEVLGQLSSREKMLLKLYYWEESTLKQIGQLLKVHESTASRLIDRLKNRIRKNVEKSLKHKHQVRPADLLDLIETGLSNSNLDLKKMLSHPEENQWIKDG